MSDRPLQLVVAAFDREEGAEKALKTLKTVKAGKLIGIEDGAVVRRSQKDKIMIRDVRDGGGSKGLVVDGIFGVVMGLLTGGAGLVLAGTAGSLAGGLITPATGQGFPNKRLKALLGKRLKPGTSAMVAVVEDKGVVDLETALAEAGAAVMIEALNGDIHASTEA